jgi:hypothetical protein
MEPIKLIDEQVYEVSFVRANLPYKNGERSKKGETFTRYSRNGVAFPVPTDHPFHEDFKNGNVKCITLIPGSRTVEVIDKDGGKSEKKQDTLDFSSYINKAQWNSLRDERLNDARVNAQIKRYETLATMEVSDELLAKLETVAPIR